MHSPASRPRALQCAGVLEDVDVRDDPDQALSVVHDRNRAHPLIGEDPARRPRTARPGARRTRRGSSRGRRAATARAPARRPDEAAATNHRRPCGRRGRTGCRRRADRRRRWGDAARSFGHSRGGVQQVVVGRGCGRRAGHQHAGGVIGLSVVSHTSIESIRRATRRRAGTAQPRRRFRQCFSMRRPERARSARHPHPPPPPAPHFMRTGAFRAGALR